MDCSSGPGVIAGSKEPRSRRADVAPPPRIAPPLLRGSRAAAGAGALPGARRRCEAGKRTHGPGPRACLALLAAAALLALAAPAQAQTEVWSATLTTGDLSSGILGCSNGVGTARCSSTSVLSEDSFTYDSTAYNITGLFVRSNGQLEFIVDVDLTTTTLADLTLVVGSTSLVLSGGTASGTVKLIFSSSGVSLTAGTDITVKLTAPGTPNTAATGAPTITGTAQVGKTLTAVTTGITDADGLTSPTYTYQWIRVDGTDEEDISGENSSTYTLVDADLGKTIKVKVSFTDDASNAETLTSAATVTVAADTTPPEVESVTVPISGGEVELVFDEDLDETVVGTLLVNVFSLTVAGQAVTIRDQEIRATVLALYVQNRHDQAGPDRRSELHRPHRRRRHRRAPGLSRQRCRLLHHRHVGRPGSHQRLHRRHHQHRADGGQQDGDDGARTGRTPSRRTTSASSTRTPATRWRA